VSRSPNGNGPSESDDDADGMPSFVPGAGYMSMSRTSFHTTFMMPPTHWRPWMSGHLWSQFLLSWTHRWQRLLPARDSLVRLGASFWLGSGVDIGLQVNVRRVRRTRQKFLYLISELFEPVHKKELPCAPLSQIPGYATLPTCSAAFPVNVLSIGCWHTSITICCNDVTFLMPKTVCMAIHVYV